MANQTMAQLIDEIASIVVMADAEDVDSLEELQPLFLSLKGELEEGRNTGLVEIVVECINILKDIGDKSPEIIEQDLGVINEKITELVQTLQRAEREIPGELSQEDSPEDSLEESPEDSSNSEVTDVSDSMPGQEFTLEEWIDEETFREFLSNQKLVMDEMEGDILDLEKGGAKSGGGLKRKLHTLKGEAGMLGLEDLEKVCHAVEDFLNNPTQINERTDTLLRIMDWVGEALESYSEMRLPHPTGAEIIETLSAPSSQTPSKETEKEAESIVEEKVEVTAAETAESTAEEKVEVTAAETTESTVEEKVEDNAEESSWDEETVELIGEFLEESDEGLTNVDEVLMSFDEEEVDLEKVNALFRTFHTIKGVSGFLELAQITSLAHNTETMLNRVREGNLDMARPVLDLVFDATELMRQMLQGVRDAVEQSTTLPEIPELQGLIEKINKTIQTGGTEEEQLPPAEPGEKIGDILSRSPTMIPTSVIDTALKTQKETGRRLGEELVAQGAAKPKQVSQALRAQKRADGKGATKIKETVKVDLERVDNLVEMIGELVIVESMVVNSPEIESISNHRVRDYLGQLAKITHDLQDVGMRMRMVPVRGVFQKMARMVRDLSRKGGKDVKFVASGEGTEIDRSMVERITDPLVHMIRNSVDHGVEPSSERLSVGKSRKGMVKLSAYHEGGSVVIEIADDGRGLDREAILKKAIKQNLIKDGESMSDDAVFKLIFAPGFSTAQKVTEISGRGVGMDVVKKNIDAMRGRVSISSVMGKGTTFKLILPLTLAIIDGMLVASGDERYIVPTLSIIESFQPDHSTFLTFAEKGELINLRGEILPLVRMSTIFGIPDAKQDPMEGLVVVVEGVGRRMGLLVDDVLTQQQVVIKTLGEGLGKSQYVSGAAILSDGRVGLILNIDDLASSMEEGIKQTPMSQVSDQLVANSETGSVPLQATAE